MNKSYRVIGLAGLVCLALAVAVVAATSFTDRQPRVTIDREAVEAEMEEAAELERELTVEERLQVAEEQIARLYRITDPLAHRDEMRLERRVRDLENKVETLEREIRRIQTDPRR